MSKPTSAIAAGALIASGIVLVVFSRGGGGRALQTAECQRLLQRAEAGDSIDSFRAILKLRDQPDQRAIPALRRVLIRYAGSKAIHRFAAAQALSAINTKRAHEILAKHLLSGKWPTTLSVMYAFDWNMEPAQRDLFLERYHLRNTSQDLSLELRASPGEGDRSHVVDFAATITNVSRRGVRIHLCSGLRRMVLLLRSPRGHFVWRGVCRTEAFPQQAFPELPPGAEKVIQVAGEAAWGPADRLPNVLPRPGALVLDCEGVIHLVERPGRFRVYAVYCCCRPSDAAEKQLRQAGPPELWTGTLASQPVEVEIAPAPKSAEVSS